MMSDRLFIVIPAKDEAGLIGKVLHGLRTHGYQHIVVVNDGSEDATAEIAEAAGCHVLTHRVNLGSGAATQTGIEYALTQGAEVIVTMDADGQHAPEDVALLMQGLEDDSVAVAIGSRFLQPSGKVPVSRRFFNQVGSMLTWLLTGMYAQDSQSGMKAIRADFARKIEFHFHGYEFCTELFHILHKQHARFVEVPIQAIYTRESMQKGQNFWEGFRMLFRLLWWKS